MGQLPLCRVQVREHTLPGDLTQMKVWVGLGLLGSKLPGNTGAVCILRSKDPKPGMADPEKSLGYVMSNKHSSASCNSGPSPTRPHLTPKIWRVILHGPLESPGLHFPYKYQIKLALHYKKLENMKK